jgi:hypothetical protein
MKRYGVDGVVDFDGSVEVVGVFFELFGEFD